MKISVTNLIEALEKENERQYKKWSKALEEKDTSAMMRTVDRSNELEVILSKLYRNENEEIEITIN